MDDFLLLAADRGEARDRLTAVRTFLNERLRLELNPRRVLVAPVGEPCDLLGYVHHADGRARVRRRSVRRLWRRLPALERRLAAGAIDRAAARLGGELVWPGQACRCLPPVVQHLSAARCRAHRQALVGEVIVRASWRPGRSHPSTVRACVRIPIGKVHELPDELIGAQLAHQPQERAEVSSGVALIREDHAAVDAPGRELLRVEPREIAPVVGEQRQATRRRVLELLAVARRAPPGFDRRLGVPAAPSQGFGDEWVTSSSR
jgi:hypothetical protein